MIGNTPGHDYVILVTFHNNTQRVYGVFESWRAAFDYKNDRLPSSVKSAKIMPIEGVH